MTKKTLLLLLIVLALGLPLRLKGLTTGLPSDTGRLSTHHFDEYITFGALGRMEPAKLNFFASEALYWGTFHVYLQGAVLKGMQAAGIFTPGDKDYLRQNLAMADRMYVSGRLISIIFSCLAIILLYYISAGLLSGYFALIPPLFLALAYVDIYMASLVKPDSLMLFFGLCSLYFTLKAVRGEGGLKTQLLAGAFNGLSFVTKYTGLVFGFHYAAAAAYRAAVEKAPGKWLARLALYILAAAAVFLLVNPYFILRNADTLYYMKAMFAKTNAAASVFKAYLEYLTQVLPASLGWPAAVLGLVSAVYALVSGRAELRIAAAFVAVYLLKFGCAADMIFTYSLPLIPFFALSCGYFIEKKLSGKPALLALAAAVFLYTAAYSAYQKYLWSDANTKAAASAWLEKSVPSGSLVCVSKVDVWTPEVLRRYEPGLRLRAATGPEALLSDSIKELVRTAGDCDYAVLSEFETDVIAGDEALSWIPERLAAGFEKAAEFRRPRSPLFVLPDGAHYLAASLMNPDTTVYRRKR